MELWNNFWVILGAVLGLYILVFLRKFNHLWYFLKLGSKVYNALPPGDMGWPLIGSSLTFYKAFNIDGNPNSFVDDLVSRHGKVGMYKSHLYWTPVIIVTDPEASRRIHLNEERFNLNYPKTASILLHGDGSLRKLNPKILHRLVAAPINGSEALSRYVEFIEKLTMKSLEEWSSRKEIELVDELKGLTFKIITRVFIGTALTHLQASEIERLYANICPVVFSMFSYDFPGSAFRQALQARDEILNILEPIVEEKRRVIEKDEEMEETCQMDAILKAKDENGEILRNNNNAAASLLLGLLFGGQHTSAHAAVWLLIYVLQHPRVYQKAKEEQEMIIKQRPSTQKGLSFKEIKQMTYAAKVINETLRMCNITFANFRRATRDVNINGYTIPKGWTVLPFTRSIHMDPQIYPNPQKFDPSRWENYSPKPGTFVPFGMGGRYCPGNELARLEMTILLHHFLLHYKWERLNPKASISYLPIPAPLDNCLAKFSKLPTC